MNRVILMGRLVETPSIKITPSDIGVCSFRLAVSRRFNHEKADFINCVAWRKTAEFISKHFDKGDMIAIVGRIENQTWEDSDGAKRQSTKIVAEEVYFTGSKNKKLNESSDFLSNAEEDFSEEDLPFNA